MSSVGNARPAQGFHTPLQAACAATNRMGPQAPTVSAVTKVDAPPDSNALEAR
jgi:hypothetical protein